MEKEKMGEFILALRKEHGMTQKEMADALGLTDKAISKWERGLSYPDISMLEPIAVLFEVSVMELLKGERIEPDTTISMQDAQKMIDESISLSDDEITQKHKKNKGIILTLCVVTMFLISLILNVRNIMSDETYKEVTLDRASVAYEITVNEVGEEMFVNPDAALEQIIEDLEEQGLQEGLTDYLHILQNSIEEENE
ncbi:MAG: helix-turn-helix transcriptional regulator [Lachnospiraceae bacterium]|nr:helix-turn-helix transcriptional regulator [Lachnospiraceae bacterium]